MKPFHFFKINQFPNLTLSNPTVKSQIQSTFFGEGEKIETAVTLTRNLLSGSLGRLRIKSGVERTASGYIKKVVKNKLQKITFTRYIHPVIFTGYMDHIRKIVFFQAPKRVCKGVLSNIKNTSMGIDLSEMEVDFAKAYEICPRYSAVWFRDISSYVRSAGLSGNRLEKDTLFQSMSKLGQLSSVVITWTFEGSDHPIMLTGSGGIILVLDYGDNWLLEVRLVLDLYDGLLSKVWQDRAKGKRPDSGSILEPGSTD